MFFRLYPRTNEYIRLQTLIQPSTPNIQKPLQPTMPLSQKAPEDHAAQIIRPHPAKVTDPLKKSLPSPTPTPTPPPQTGLRQQIIVITS